MSFAEIFIVRLEVASYEKYLGTLKQFHKVQLNVKKSQVSEGKRRTYES